MQVFATEVTKCPGQDWGILCCGLDRALYDTVDQRSAIAEAIIESRQLQRHSTDALTETDDEHSSNWPGILVKKEGGREANRALSANDTTW